MLNNRFGLGTTVSAGISMSRGSITKFRGITMSRIKSDCPIPLSADLSRMVFLL